LQGGTFGKLAVLTKDTKALAEKVSASGGGKKTGGGDVLFAGEVPGIGTKVQTPNGFVRAWSIQQESVARIRSGDLAAFNNDPSCCSVFVSRPFGS